MDKTDVVYTLCVDNDYEGLGEPLAFYTSREAADHAASVYTEARGNVVVSEVHLGSEPTTQWSAMVSNLGHEMVNHDVDLGTPMTRPFWTDGSASYPTMVAGYGTGSTMEEALDRATEFLNEALSAQKDES